MNRVNLIEIDFWINQWTDWSCERNLIHLFHMLAATPGPAKLESPSRVRLALDLSSLET